MATPDLEDVKESVRQGVSKVAGRLSNMASGVFTSLQVGLLNHPVEQS
jgi:ADP-ribosylation factor GTPase-activating protein 2/3